MPDVDGITRGTAAAGTEMPRAPGSDLLTDDREDPEFRSLAATATLGLTRCLPIAVHARRDPPVGGTVIAALIVALAMVAVRQWVPAVSETRAAKVHDAADFISSDETTASRGRFLVPTVSHPPSEPAARAMDSSRGSVLTAASRCAGVATQAQGIAIDMRGVTGGSAGLMLALTVLDRLVPEDLLRGRTIAGTGAIGSGGRVGAVAEVGRKAAAAEGAGADLFLVPSGQARDAVEATDALDVVAVGSLSQAVRALGGRGCDDRVPSGRRSTG